MRTETQRRRPARFRQLRILVGHFERRHIKKDMLHYILMGDLHRKMCVTDKRRQRYVDFYKLYCNLRKYITKPQQKYYPYIEYRTATFMYPGPPPP